MRKYWADYYARTNPDGTTKLEAKKEQQAEWFQANKPKVAEKRRQHRRKTAQRKTLAAVSALVGGESV